MRIIAKIVVLSQIILSVLILSALCRLFISGELIDFGIGREILAEKYLRYLWVLFFFLLTIATAFLLHCYERILVTSSLAAYLPFVLIPVFLLAFYLFPTNAYHFFWKRSTLELLCFSSGVSGILVLFWLFYQRKVNLKSSGVSPVFSLPNWKLFILYGCVIYFSWQLVTPNWAETPPIRSDYDWEILDPVADKILALNSPFHYRISLIRDNFTYPSHYRNKIKGEIFQALETEADISQMKTVNGQCRPSLIEAAIKSNAIDVVEKLLDRGAKLEESCEHPISWLATRHGTEIEKLLLKKGLIDFNKKYEDHYILPKRLRYGCSAQGVNKIKFYLENGADPNIAGGQPLYFAVKHNCTETVKVLLAYGANPNQTYKSGKTLLELIETGEWQEPDTRFPKKALDQELVRLLNDATKN